jgi:hypothetical protein
MAPALGNGNKAKMGAGLGYFRRTLDFDLLVSH